MTTTTPTSTQTFAIGGDLPVRRLGYGSMQLTGPGHWYHPADVDAAKKLLRRAIELGVNHIDTADAYGPETVEHLIRKALHPYLSDLVIATKGGLTRQGPNRWAPVGRPEYLRQCVEMSLRRLALERIDLYYLHRIDPQVPLADQVGALAELQAEGKIRHLGLSKVTRAQIDTVKQTVTVAAVQNKYHRGATTHDDVLDYCEQTNTAFVPYAPLAAGHLATGSGHTTDGLRPAQAALAWLLDRSPVVLPIPGTTSMSHLSENFFAGSAAAHTS